MACPSLNYELGHHGMLKPLQLKDGFSHLVVLVLVLVLVFHFEDKLDHHIVIKMVQPDHNIGHCVILVIVVVHLEYRLGHGIVLNPSRPK